MNETAGTIAILWMFSFIIGFLPFTAVCTEIQRKKKKTGVFTRLLLVLLLVTGLFPPAFALMAIYTILSELFNFVVKGDWV